MRRLPNSSTVTRQRMSIDGDALRPSFATALGGVVQPNQTLAAGSPAKLKASLSSSLGEACRDSIGTCSHFHTSQAQKSSNRGESLTPCLCLVLPQPTMIQNSRLHHSPWLWPWILSKKSCRCAAIRSNRAKRRTLHRFLSKLLQRPRPTERPHLPTKPRIGATQAFSIQPTILMR